MDRQEVTLLVLIDLCAAFDTIEREILLETLQKDFGVIGDAQKTQKWPAFYLSQRTQKKEEGKEKKFMQKEGPIVIFINI